MTTRKELGPVRNTAQTQSQTQIQITQKLQQLLAVFTFVLSLSPEQANAVAKMSDELPLPLSPREIEISLLASTTAETQPTPNPAQPHPDTTIIQSKPFESAPENRATRMCFGIAAIGWFLTALVALVWRSHGLPFAMTALLVAAAFGASAILPVEFGNMIEAGLHAAVSILVFIGHWPRRGNTLRTALEM